MTGMRLRDLMLAACVMALVVASISVQLTMAGQMVGQDRSRAETVMAIAR